jgi:hypothetical protein
MAVLMFDYALEWTPARVVKSAKAPAARLKTAGVTRNAAR